MYYGRYYGQGHRHHHHRFYPLYDGGVNQNISQTLNIFNVGGTVNATQNAGQLAG